MAAGQDRFVTDSRSPLDTALDLFLYLPVGVAVTAAEEVPKLAAKGRARLGGQVAMAKVVGRFAVAQGRKELSKRFSGGQPGGQVTPRPSRRAGQPEPYETGVDLGAGEVSFEELLANAEAMSDQADGQGLSDVTIGGGPGGQAAIRDMAGGLPPDQGGVEGSRSGGGDDGGRSQPASGGMAAGDAGPGPGVSSPGPGVSSPGPGPAPPSPGASPPSPGASPPRPGVSSPGPEASPPSPTGLAIPGYDSLAASQVVPRLAGLSPEELAAVGAYESAHRARRTILTRVRQLQER
jgi:hypothetical protein